MTSFYTPLLHINNFKQLAFLKKNIFFVIFNSLFLFVAKCEIFIYIYNTIILSSFVFIPFDPFVIVIPKHLLHSLNEYFQDILDKLAIQFWDRKGLGGSIVHHIHYC